VKRVLQIPDQLELHGITYKVKMLDDLVARNDNLGEASYRLNEILIQTIVPGAPMTQDRQGQVFCHELVHHILREMNDAKRDDEAFVDLFAALLHQALVTAEYEDDDDPIR